MEVVNTQILNIGLNVLGYLVAAALGMLVYSAFQSRRRRPVPVPVSTPTPIEKEVTAAPEPSPNDARSNYEFVDLRQTSTAEDSETSITEESETKPAKGYRDRPEIVRLARKMVKAGTSREMIKRTLPISDVELALLQTGNNK
jgi:hypothetical protein